MGGRASSEQAHPLQLDTTVGSIHCCHVCIVGTSGPVNPHAQSKSSGATARGSTASAPSHRPTGVRLPTDTCTYLEKELCPQLSRPPRPADFSAKSRPGGRPRSACSALPKSSRRSDRLSTPTRAASPLTVTRTSQLIQMTSVPLDQFDRTFGSLIGELPPSRLRTADAVCLRRDASQSSLVKPSVQRSSRSPTSSSQTPRASSAYP
jgi:hypothetical protein